MIVGAQWGDEGKGKITHYMAEKADIVARYNGGNNAGHTVNVAGQEFRLHHIPSGILYPETLCVLGNGMVIDLPVLWKEIKGLRERGHKVENLRISENAHLVMPYHRLIDQWQEGARGDGRLGTTGRGIGPAYVDKAARCGIRAMDLLAPEVFQDCFKRNIADKIGTYPFLSEIDKDEVVREHVQLARELAPWLCDTSVLLCRALEEGKEVIFEGAQGTLLDLDFGTYPYVTSSTALSGGAGAGAGVPPRHLQDVMGVVKAYTTRVGVGPFPTELTDEVGTCLRETGKEYGTTTGRPRRCGWLDAVALRYAKRLNGLTTIAITKLDVLTGQDPVRICVAYNYRGEPLESFPTNPRVLAEVTPVYRDFSGWTQSLRDLKSFDDFPEPCKAYLWFLEDLLGIPATLISVGPEKDETYDMHARGCRICP